MPKKKTDTSSTPEPDTSMIDALKFVMQAQNQTGAPHTRHCILWDGWVYGTNMTLSAGAKLAADLRLAPHTATLIAALERCEGGIAMTDLGTSLVVRSGKSKFSVKCHDLATMPPIAPDPMIAVLADQMHDRDGNAADQMLRAALEVASIPVTEGAPRVICAAVKLGPGSAVGTNSHVLIEGWHGLDLPTVLMPKASVKAVLAVKQPIKGIGVSAGSITFHYADDSWLKTQLYTDAYPDHQRIFTARKPNAWPIPPGFYEALHNLKPFTHDDKQLCFGKNELRTEETAGQGSSVEIAGISEGRKFNIDYLLMLEPYVKQADFGSAWANSSEGTALFFGHNIRAAISPMHWQPPVVQPKTQAFDDMSDDIPF